MRNQEKLKSFVGGQNVSVRKSRKVGCGRTALFPKLDNRVSAWVTERNGAGLRVKDKYIEVKAKSVRDEMIEEVTAKIHDDPSGEWSEDLKKLQAFGVSNSWLSRFKSRFNFVSRRHTTCRKLPLGFERIACNFVSQIQTFIGEKKIEASRIINLDQVPRYFETENTSTIITRGTKEVRLHKSSSAHKRFTATPIIAASGKFVAMHLLFSKLKKIPLNIDPSCMVDVNDTGMWNDAILTRVIEEVIKKVQNPINRLPVLILLDSYGTHIKHVQQKSRYYERMNVYFRIVPPNMTGMLQPLDVAINRGFQQSYGDRYTEFVAQAVQSKDASLQTGSGNVKMPTYALVSSWVSEWMKSLAPQSIAKAFELCGIVDPANFDLENMHKPLRDCFSDDFSAEQWEAQHAAAVACFPDGFEDVNTDWIFYDMKFSFFKALHESSFKDTDEDFDTWSSGFKVKVLNYINDDPLLTSLFKDDEKALFESGKSTGAAVEMYAVARILEVKLRITDVDKQCNKLKEYEWGEDNCGAEISLLCFDNIFGIVRKTD